MGRGSSRNRSAPRRAAVYRFFLRPFDPPLAVPVAPDGTILICCSLALLRKHFARRPASNPIERFGERLARDLPALQAAGLPTYHAWAFAGIRQAGSAFELAAAHLRWLAGFGRGELLPAAASFEAIAQGNKALILKGARAVNSGRPLDSAPLVQEMAQAWDRGMASLGEVL